MSTAAMLAVSPPDETMSPSRREERSTQKKKKSRWRVAGGIVHHSIESLILGPMFGLMTLSRALSPATVDIKVLSTSPADNDDAVVVLLHGVDANASEFAVARSVLVGCGRRVATFDWLIDDSNCRWLLSHPKDVSMHDATLLLRKRLQHVRAATGSSRFVLVGHSLGGVIATTYAERFADDDGIEVPAVVTLHSPLRGSPMADDLHASWPFKSALMSDLTTNSAMLSSVRSDALQSIAAGRRRYFHIAGSNDLMVPPEFAVLSEGVDAAIVPTRTRFNAHFGIAVDTSAWHLINSWIVDACDKVKAQQWASKAKKAMEHVDTSGVGDVELTHVASGDDDDGVDDL